ncbi:MAG: galactokinase [Ginsengibacter sp.]
MANQHNEVLKAFREKFPGEPQVYFSPGRINLIGEHVDYNDGYVMPGAIDKGIWYAFALNESEVINFYSIDFKEALSINIHAIQKMESWKNYVLGVINEFIKDGKKIQGFDCAFGGDIPNGAGMSSSAAVEGGLAMAINEVMKFGYDRKQLALLCQRAEHGFPGVNCGIMDQYANMFGKKDHVLLLDCKSITHEYLPFNFPDYNIILVNSNVHHSLADSAYNQRRRECEEGLKIIRENTGITSFRDLVSEDEMLAIKNKMNETVFRRCLYVVQEIFRTKKAAQFLKNKDLDSFGKLMFQTHEGLRKLYEVSCVELDFLVDFSANFDGVAGARLMGGGFGGCTINLVKKDSKEIFIKQISEAYKKKFSIEANCYDVQLVDGTHVL